MAVEKVTPEERARRLEQGKRVRQARAGMRPYMSQTKLAALVTGITGDEISRGIISLIEAGKRDAELGILEAIAAVTGEDLDQLTARELSRARGLQLSWPVPVAA